MANTALLELPTIVSYSCEFNLKGERQTWTILAYQDFNGLLGTAPQLYPEIISSLESFVDFKGQFIPAPYRQQIELKTTPLLASVFWEKKEILLASPRLGLEMFVLQSLAPGELKEHDIFLKYVEKILSLRTSEFPSTWEMVSHRFALPNLANEEYKNLESSTDKITQQLLLKINAYRPGLFEKCSDIGLGLTAQYALLRVHLLKFLAILPSLSTDETGAEVKRVLLEALRRLLDDSKNAHDQGKKGQERSLPKTVELLVHLGLLAAAALPASILSSLVRKLVKLMAKRFIAGENIELARGTLLSLAKSGRDATLDQLGELVVSEKEADHYFQEVLKLIRGLSLHIKKGEKNAAGINRAHVSIKVSALSPHFKPLAFDYSYEKVAPRLKEILLVAKECDVFINIDAEHYHYRDLVFKIYKKVLLETKELFDFKATGIVLQAYLRDAYVHLEQIVDLAKERGCTMPVRLVKGAYWDAETVEAEVHAHEAPEFLNKEETDLHYRQLIVCMFKSYPHIQLCLASHNFADHAFAEALRSRDFSHTAVIEHQCLHMTYEALSTALAGMGWPVRNYMPVGGLLEGMAYLVRRIMENSSQVGVLTIMRSHKKKQALVSAYEIHLEKKKHGRLFRDSNQAHMTSKFFNVAPVLTYLESEAQWLLKTYSNTNLSLSKPSFLLQGKEEIITSPSDGTSVVGKIVFACKEDARKAVTILDETYNKGEWANSSSMARSLPLLRAALIMLSKRLELSHLISLESGKTVQEALGDVDEAIDFLNFYAREEVRLTKKYPDSMSRGVVAVISPWNFPLAIPCGMVAAPLVAGNTVVLKSAEQTPLIAQELVAILHQAGIPRDVFIHLPGTGEEVGAALVSHPRVAQIVFTGSKAVGMMIKSQAERRVLHNKLYNVHIPVKVITEMGGKNAIIVAANAELDETVSGILASAFGHAGQKCSALSRVIVHHSLKDKLAERLKLACMDLKVGKATDFSTTTNPVISKEEKERLIRQVKEAKEEAIGYGGRVVVDRSQEVLDGHSVGPVIFDVPKTLALSPHGFAQKELFGPVVHIISFETLDEAIHLFNATEYALTGGIFAQSQDDIDYCLLRLECGNIYVNRTITGARVAIEPFGGFKHSGTGPKAGGRHYVSSFHLSPLNMPLQKELSLPPITPQNKHQIDFPLSRASGLRTKGRAQRLVKSMDYLIRDFESLYQGLYGENKKILKKFRRFIEEDSKGFLEYKHPNRKIPGQLSYNDYHMTEEGMLLIADEPRAYFASVLSVIAAISSGVGVTIVARNATSYTWWKTFQSYFKENGISSSNFDVWQSSKEQIKKAINSSEISVIAVDGPLDSLFEVMELNESFDKKFLTPFDAPPVKAIKSYYLPFIRIRSVAMNVMRHGAPLDLDL